MNSVTGLSFSFCNVLVTFGVLYNISLMSEELISVGVRSPKKASYYSQIDADRHLRSFNQRQSISLCMLGHVTFNIDLCDWDLTS